ncbi:glycosyltransferase [Pseudoalteromonas maricaloris]|uniref:glycosyltransferase n=1 Tax=Pseudoalteromonas maricaloris TaxID=184924 RepID=UPI000299D5C6|nr:glycosyltransferase [Pseudoalteromonas flavipulchra]
MKNNEAIIYHVITNFTVLGGAESALIRVINNSQSTPFKVISLMAKSLDMVDRITHPNCEVIALGANNALSLLRTAFKLAENINEDAPLKAYSWMYHANAISAMASLLSFKKAPLVWGVRHSLDDYSGEKKSTKLAIQISKLLKFVPDKVIYCSQKAQMQHEQFGYNSPCKSVYVPNGYAFHDLQAKNYNNTPIVLGAAGRFHEAKDYRTLFKVVKRLKAQSLSVDLRVCGRGMSEQNEALIALLDSVGLSLEDLTLLGEVNDMPSFYQGLDVFILSSKTEGFPNVLAEAASYGCAVFSTDVGDAPYIINNSDHIAPIKDDVKLAGCIARFISLPPEDREKVALKTTMHVRKNFSIKTIARRFLEV